MKSMDFFQHITIEPTIFLSALAAQITAVIQQSLHMSKACLVDHNFPKEICDNLSQHVQIHAEVQKTVSTFYQWEMIATKSFIVVIAFFIGSWSDRRGRKIPLLMGLTGQLLLSLGILLNIHFDKWPLHYMIYTATIPSAMTGLGLAIYSSAYSYVSDVSSVENRTFRITILGICASIPSPMGYALGSYLFTNVTNPYFVMFSIKASIVTIAIIYSMIKLKRKTSPTDESFKAVGFCEIFGDFFDKNHAIDTIGTLIKKRAERNRLLLWIFLVTIFFDAFSKNEQTIAYLYMRHKFQWDHTEISNYRIVISGTYILLLLCGMPIMKKIFHWRDTTIAMFGASTLFISRFIIPFVHTTELFYAIGIIAMIGPGADMILRSMTSKIVPFAERGKVITLLSVCENIVHLVSSIFYSNFYKLTIGFGSFYFLTAIASVIVFFLMLSVRFILKGTNLNSGDSSSDTISDETNKHNENQKDNLKTSKHTEIQTIP